MSMTIQQAIDRIISAVPGAPFPDTVDTVKTGDTSRQLTGIAFTFMANSEAIEQALQLGANLLITHEPTFYNHLDTTTWLGSDPVYHAKQALIAGDQLVIWRFHDYLHSIKPDCTVVGLIKALGWEASGAEDQSNIIQVAPMRLSEMAQWVKQYLGLPFVRVVGDLDMTCQRVALWPGAPGPANQIPSLGLLGADVLITGEISEWETSEYVRDASNLGFKKGLIITGHAVSEEPGIRWIIPWLEARLPGEKIQFIPHRSPFQIL